VKPGDGDPRRWLACRFRALEAKTLVAQEGLSEREAFERLRRQARRQRRRVVEVAAEILAAIRDRA
jgi:AmiR/NasT family two-component response regulator